MRIFPSGAALLAAFAGTVTFFNQSNTAQTTPTTASAPPMESVAMYITPVTKEGIPLTGLKPDDLRISENKLPAMIDKITCAKPDAVLLGVLVDVSGSRRRDPNLESHYEALHGFVNRLLTGDDAAYLVDFADFPVRLGDATGDRAVISAAFDKLRRDRPGGSTAMYDAIKTSANTNFSGHGGRRVLVVVGDWADNSSRNNLEEAVQATQRNSATVYAIVDATDSGSYRMDSYKHARTAAQKVTEETGGMYYDVHSEKDFAVGLQAIQVAIAGSCRVDYSVPKAAPKKKGIRLQVEANSKEISILYPRVRF